MSKDSLAKHKKITNGLKVFRNWAAIIATVFFFILFSLLRPDTFLTYNNIITIMRSIAITTVLAIGLTITLAVGGFDLSGGAMATVTGYFLMSFLLWYGVNFWLALLISIVITLILTSITMFLIIKCKIPDLLATCAMVFILQGLGLTYTGGGAISAGMPRPDGKAPIGSIPKIMDVIGSSPLIMILIMLLCVVIAHVFLNYTKYGRQMYAIGGNKKAARLSGIPVKKYRFLAGMIAAIFIAIAGVMVVCRNSSAQIQGADGYQLPALAAVFIGCSVFGKEKANIVGTLVGALLLGILDNGLLMCNVPYYTLPLVKGLALAIALIGANVSKSKDA